MEQHKDGVYQKSGRLKKLQCLRCGESIVCYGLRNFKLGEDTHFSGGLNRLVEGSIAMHMYCCSACGKVECFIPEDTEMNGISP